MSLEPNFPAIAVECQQLVKSFGEGSEQVMALRGLDVSINVGELFMLVGPSGCGKTTLISIMAGTLNQDSGVCRVLGEDVKAMRQGAKNAFRAKNIGFVFQAFNLLPTLKAYENAAVPLIINGVPRGQAHELAKELLVRLGLGDRMNAFPSQLSGGQQQRVAIARALVHNPHLVVCDEPTSSLDFDTGRKIMELLRALADEGKRTMVIVTHDSRIFHYADRIAQMDDGMVVNVTNDPKTLAH